MAISRYEGPSGPSTSQDSTYLYLLGRPTVPIPIVTLAATKQLLTMPCILAGWSIIEQAGAAAVWDIFDGDDNTGQLVGALGFAAGGASVVGPGPDGPYCKIGLTLARVSGTIRGAIWVKI